MNILISRRSITLLTVYTIIEALLLVTALSIDTFISSLAYGTNKIKIPFSSAMIINIICSVFLAVSILLGEFFEPYVSENLIQLISFFLLFSLGIIKLFNKKIKKLFNYLKQISLFKQLKVDFFMNIYTNPEKADLDTSKSLSNKEAIWLALTLAVDGLSVGFGAGLTSINHFLVIFFSLFSDMIAIYLGCYIGIRIAKKTSFDLSWLSGLILIFLAFSKL